MGVLLDGNWVDQVYSSAASGGRFIRGATKFRNWITPDGSAGSSVASGFKAERGCYHLSSLRRLSLPAGPSNADSPQTQEARGSNFSLSVVRWLLANDGWAFTPGVGIVAATVKRAKRHYEVYLKADALF